MGRGVSAVSFLLKPLRLSALSLPTMAFSVASRSAAARVAAPLRRPAVAPSFSSLRRRTIATTSAKMAHPPPYYEGEPERPVVKTEIPGPTAMKETKDLHEVFDTQASSLLTDYSKCSGNYIADRDGNLLLDV